MNIKSLLLGSAAAMVAVSSAQAADAVVVEAEPVEYVRVCDAYGSGYFFIPGTETCIRFGGYVRSTYSKLNVEGDESGADVESTQWASRINLDIDIRNETDWGTLRSLIRFRSNNADGDGGDSQFEVDQAFLTIAGLRVGVGGSLFNANFAAGVNLEGVPQIFEDGIYGFSNNLVLDYTYAIDGLSLSVGVEDIDGFPPGGVTNVDGVTTRGGRDASNALFLAKAQYSADFGSVGIVGEFSESGANDNDVYKAYATLDLSEFVPGGILGGYYIWQDLDVGGASNQSRFLGVQADQSWGLGFQANLTDQIEFIAYHNEISGVGQSDESLTTIGLNWYPVSGLKVYGFYSFGDTISGNGALVNNARGPFANPTTNGGSFTAGEDVSFDQFLIGIRRNF